MILTQQPWVEFPPFPQKNFRRKIIHVVEIYQWHWLEESGQRLKNVDPTHLDLASGKQHCKKQHYSTAFSDKGVKPIGQRLRKRNRFLRFVKDPTKSDTTLMSFYQPQPTEEEGSAPVEALPVSDSEVDGANKVEVPAKVLEFEAAIRDIENDQNLKEKIKFGLQNWIGTRYGLRPKQIWARYLEGDKIPTKIESGLVGIGEASPIF